MSVLTSKVAEFHKNQPFITIRKRSSARLVPFQDKKLLISLLRWNYHIINIITLLTLLCIVILLIYIVILPKFIIIIFPGTRCKNIAQDIFSRDWLFIHLAVYTYIEMKYLHLALHRSTYCACSKGPSQKYLEANEVKYFSWGGGGGRRFHGHYFTFSTTKWLHVCVYHHRMKPKVGRNFTSERGEGVKGEVKNISLHWLQGTFETVPKRS